MITCDYALAVCRQVVWTAAQHALTDGSEARFAAASMGLHVSLFISTADAFPHIKTVCVQPCHRVMDCIVLFSPEEKRGSEGGREG